MLEEQWNVQLYEVDLLSDPLNTFQYLSNLEPATIQKLNFRNRQYPDSKVNDPCDVILVSNDIGFTFGLSKQQTQRRQSIIYLTRVPNIEIQQATNPNKISMDTINISETSDQNYLFILTIYEEALHIIIGDTWYILRNPRTGCEIEKQTMFSLHGYNPKRSIISLNLNGKQIMFSYRQAQVSSQIIMMKCFLLNIYGTVSIIHQQLDIPDMNQDLEELHQAHIVKIIQDETVTIFYIALTSQDNIYLLRYYTQLQDDQQYFIAKQLDYRQIQGTLLQLPIQSCESMSVTIIYQLCNKLQTYIWK